MKNLKLFKSVTAILALAFALSFNSAVAEDKAGLELGVLKCSVVPGSRVNLLIRSTADVQCTFNNQGVLERYNGEAGIALGLDLSFKSDEHISFAVISATSNTNPGAYALAGKYVGGQAAASVGVGLGAKVLVGAGAQNLSLQPLALETNKGLGASAGIGFLYIEKAN
ncbi:MAG: hypothetical protein ACI9SC_000411 [Gammaproteobacteria bacterium]|jgi:hypothetical protein